MSRFSLFFFFLALFVTPPVQASPNVSVATTFGGGKELVSGGRGIVDIGLRGDVIFRERDTDQGFGAFGRASTPSFRALDFAAGPQWLIPVFEQVPFVLSAGPLVRIGDTAKAGAMGNFFVGSRSHNFHGIYGYSGGVFLEGRTFFESNPVHEFVAGAQIDVMLMALPAIAFINLFR